MNAVEHCDERSGTLPMHSKFYSFGHVLPSVMCPFHNYFIFLVGV